MKIRTAILIIALVALPLAGCIENMRDLKDRLEPAATQDVDPEPLAQVEENETENVTRILKAPIARISIYGDGGALVYKATFVAEDEASPLRVDEGVPLTLNGVDSEVRENGATIEKYEWTLGTQTLEGRQVTLTPDTPGIHPLTLVVTDTNGKSDNHTVTLAIAPAPFDEVIQLTTTGPVVGVEGSGSAGTGTFDVKDEIDGMVVKAVAATVVAKPPRECDAGVEVLDGEGNSLGNRDSAGHADPEQTETLMLGELAAGAYTVSVYGYVCATPDGVPVTVTITYVPVLEGIAADDHGAHAH